MDQQGFIKMCFIAHNIRQIQNIIHHEESFDIEGFQFISRMKGLIRLNWISFCILYIYLTLNSIQK